MKVVSVFPHGTDHVCLMEAASRPAKYHVNICVGGWLDLSHASNCGLHKQTFLSKPVRKLQLAQGISVHPAKLTLCTSTINPPHSHPSTCICLGKNINRFSKKKDTSHNTAAGSRSTAEIPYHRPPPPSQKMSVPRDTFSLLVHHTCGYSGEYTRKPRKTTPTEKFRIIIGVYKILHGKDGNL